MSSFQPWKPEEIGLLQQLVKSSEFTSGPNWNRIASKLGTRRSPQACRTQYKKHLARLSSDVLASQTVMPELQPEPALAQEKEEESADQAQPRMWPVKLPATLPPKGSDVLIRCEGDEEYILGMGGVTHQVARILAVQNGSVKVHWYGWSAMHQQDEYAIVTASSGRLLGWDTKEHLELAQQHVREIEAIEHGPVEAQYQLPDPGQWVVRTAKCSKGVARVTDRAIRQMGLHCPFEVSWYLEYELSKHHKFNGYAAAKECQLATAPTMDKDRSAVQIDLSDRRSDEQTLSLMRYGDTIYIAFDDLTQFVGRKTPVSAFPKSLAAKVKVRCFAVRGEKLRQRNALPLQFYKSFIECLPRDASAAFRLRCDEGPSDAQWLLEKILEKLDEVGLEPPDDERVCLPVRDDEVLYESGNTTRRLRVRIRPGQQPLLSGADLFALIERKSRNFTTSTNLLKTVLQQFVHNRMIKFSTSTASSAEPTVPADCLEALLDHSICGLPDDKTGRRAAFAHFRDTSEYSWLCEVIQDLTDADAESSELGPDAAADGDASDVRFGSNESAHGEDEFQNIAKKWQPVEWADIKPQPPCPIPLRRPKWTEQAEECIPHASTHRKSAAPGEFEYHQCVTSEEKQMIDRLEVEGVLTGRAKPVSHWVGIAQIHDPENHVVKAARKNDYNGPVYLAYAKRGIKKHTILGEYTGRVVTDTMAELEEEERMKEMAESSSSEAAVRGEVFSKLEYNTTVGNKKWRQALVLDTSNDANELSFLNDYRLDATAGAEAAERQRKRKEHLPNVTFVEVVDKAFGRPHMLFAATRTIEKGEELLTDYGQDFWDEYSAHCKWMAALRHARAIGVADGMQQLASQLAKEQAARKAAEERKTKALEAVRKLEQQITLCNVDATRVQDAAEDDGRTSSNKRSSPGSEVHTWGTQDSRGRWCSNKRSKPSSHIAMDHRVKPDGCNRTVSFKTGEQVNCPACNMRMQAPRAAYVLRCANCRANIRPITPATPNGLAIQEVVDKSGPDSASARESDDDCDGRAACCERPRTCPQTTASRPGVADGAKRLRSRRSNAGKHTRKVFGFAVGSVVWAKLSGYPFWPGIVSEFKHDHLLDPATRKALLDMYMKLPSGRRSAPAVVLVRWCGRNERWDWVPTSKLICMYLLFAH